MVKEAPPCCTPGAHPALSNAQASALGLRKGRYVQLRVVAEVVAGSPAAATRTTTDCYVSHPPRGTAVRGSVLVLHDIFGLYTGRHPQFCDELAAVGWIAVCPDCFGDGKSRGEAALLPSWPIKGIWNLLDLVCRCKWGYMTKALKTPWEEIEPRCNAALRHAKQLYDAYETEPMEAFAIGFCWGAWPVARLLARKGGLLPSLPGEAPLPTLRGGVCFHPSLQVSGDVAGLAAAVAQPLLLAPCSDDPCDVQPDGLVAQQLAVRPIDKLHGGSVTYQFHAASC